MKKIFITGCAKTGTTLMRRLMNAFKELKVYNGNEISLDEFVYSDYNVAKRTRNSLGADILTQREFKRQEYLVLENEVHLIYMFRNREQVCKNERVSQERYDFCCDNIPDVPTHFVQYECLCRDPDTEQDSLALALDLDLNGAEVWSAYPDWVDWKEPEWLTGTEGYSLRPIKSQISWEKDFEKQYRAWKISKGAYGKTI